jgi:hypothetical protein
MPISGAGNKRGTASPMTPRAEAVKDGRRSAVFTSSAFADGRWRPAPVALLVRGTAAVFVCSLRVHWP